MADESTTAEDNASIDRAIEELRRRGWQSRASLNGVIDEWAAFVETVELGYGMTIDDYTNDLSIRAWPEEARPFLTERVASAMDDRLDELDARFREATEPLGRRLPGASDEWWGRRLPKLIVDELAEDVDRMGLRNQ